MYAIINLFIILPVTLLSFDKRVHFYTHFRSLFIAIFGVGIVFLIWDYYFTLEGVWGFNPDYLSGVYFLNLPLGEVLFFITVPYACIFIDACYQEYFGKRMTLPLVLFCIASYSTFYVLNGIGNMGVYTIVNLVYFIVLMVVLLTFDKEVLKEFFPSFLISMFPFFVVNGILTGTGIENEIVWYSESEFSGVRLFTIPYEDIMYSFNLLMSVKFAMKLIQSKFDETAS